MMRFQTAGITREQSRQNDAVTPDRGDVRKRFLSGMRHDSDELSMFDGFPPDEGEVVAQMVFGGRSFHHAARARMGGADWPLLWVQGDVCPGAHVSGVQAFVINGQPPRRIMLGGRVVGSAWSDPDADYCLLAGVLPADFTAQRGVQTQACLEQIETVLQQVGMDFSNVVRTWFYLDDLLAWYDEFNAARTSYFRNRGVFEGLVPASTGIGASNPDGAALASGTLAIRPRHSGVRIHEVPSPLQCAATAYRSSFSRAVEVAFPEHRLLIISGTASIAPDGKSMFADDIVRQIHLTLDVVDAILKSRHMRWEDTSRTVAYFRDIRDLPVFEACCRDRGIPAMPLAPAQATVCRGDLLFEIELDAIAIS